MRNPRSLMSVILGLAITASALAAVNSPEVYNNQVLVKFRPGVSRTLANLGIGATEVSYMPQTGWVVVSLPAGRTTADAVLYYQRLSSVVSVVPNYTAHASFVPNDAKYSFQYAPKRVSAVSGWDLTIGSSGIVIAIVDTGLDLGHEEFQGGKVVPGFNFVDNNNIPQDDVGHGTHCAGNAAATTNNGIGIAGIGYNCRILPVKVLDKNGSGSFSNVDKGIMYAADQGANVISLSLGATYPKAFGIPQDQIDAINYALSKNCVIVAAAGNEGVSLDTYLSVPAMIPGVLCVGASDSQDAEAFFTNYGTPVKIAAPGVDVFSTLPTSQGKYGVESGTSMSTPIVAGAAGLLWSYAPAGTFNTTIVSTLTSSADFIGTWLNGGRLNVYRGLQAIGPGVLFPQMADSESLFSGTLVAGLITNIVDGDGVNADIKPTFIRGLGYIAGVKATFTLDHTIDKLKDVTAIVVGSTVPRGSIQVFVRDFSSTGSTPKYDLLKIVPNSGSTATLDLGQVSSKYVSFANVMEVVVRQLNPTGLSLTNPTLWSVDQVRLDVRFRL